MLREALSLLSDSLPLADRCRQLAKRHPMLYFSDQVPMSDQKESTSQSQAQTLVMASLIVSVLLAWCVHRHVSHRHSFLVEVRYCLIGGICNGFGDLKARGSWQAFEGARASARVDVPRPQHTLLSAKSTLLGRGSVETLLHTRSCDHPRA